MIEPYWKLSTPLVCGTASCDRRAFAGRDKVDGRFDRDVSTPDDHDQAAVEIPRVRQSVEDLRTIALADLIRVGQPEQNSMARDVRSVQHTTRQWTAGFIREDCSL